MSQSLLYHAFGVREGYEYRSAKYVEGRVEFHLRVEKKLLVCPECGSSAIHRRRGRIRSVPIGLKETVLVVEVTQCYCPACQKSFEVSPPFARAYVLYSLSQARLVCGLSRLMPLIDVAACDMAAAYWSAILENLPDAALVFDHFHVIKLVNEKIDELRRVLWREADILKRNAIKKSRYLLLMEGREPPRYQSRKACRSTAL